MKYKAAFFLKSCNGQESEASGRCVVAMMQAAESRERQNDRLLARLRQHAKFGSQVSEMVAALNLKTVRTSFRSPWQNANLFRDPLSAAFSDLGDKVPIHGELLKLGFQISERTVSRWMKRKHPKPQLRMQVPHL